VALKPTQASPEKLAMEAAYVGKMVKFQINTLHGLGTMAGTVKAVVLREGRLTLEIKGQNGGYYFRTTAVLIGEAK
jgi:hypothetical protein